MVPILSILCPKQPLRVVEPPFLFPDLCLLGAGWSLRRRAHIPLARVSMRKSRSNRIRERTASSRLSFSSDSRNSASSSPSKLRRDWNTDWGNKYWATLSNCSNDEKPPLGACLSCALARRENEIIFAICLRSATVWKPPPTLKPLKEVRILDFHLQ